MALAPHDGKSESVVANLMLGSCLAFMPTQCTIIFLSHQVMQQSLEFILKSAQCSDVKVTYRVSH